MDQVGRHHKVHTYIQSTTVYVPSSDLDSPTPSLGSECAPPPGTKGGGAQSGG